jgi:hypothetical protein
MEPKRQNDLICVVPSLITHGLRRAQIGGSGAALVPSAACAAPFKPVRDARDKAQQLG